MSGPTRKYGRRAPSRRPALSLSRALTGKIPTHPAAADYLGRLTGWAMLGNDQAGDCVSPQTRVLTADLRWVPAGELQPGDKLLAFNEEPRDPRRPGGKRLGRNFEPSTVETANIIRRPCYDLEFEDGTKVRCSSGHRWLVGGIAGGKAQKWVETKDLKLGAERASKVVKPLDAWDTLNSFEAGYLAAAFDGEGNLDQNKAVRNGIETYSNRVVFSQTENVMLAETERCLKELGFEYRHGVQPRGGNSGADGATRKDIHRLTVGLRRDYLRLLGSVRPERVRGHLDIGRLGRIDGDTVRLVRKEFVGEQDVVFLNTTSRTYFAEGLASHNCVAVTWAHVRRLVTSIARAEDYPSQDEVWTVYRTQNPDFDPNGDAETNGPGSDADRGMDIQTLLEYLVKHGGPDNTKAVAFAKVDPTNPDEVKAAIAIFGYVWTGIVVQEANQQDFADGRPWDYHRASTDEGGHSVITGGYGPPGPGPLGGDERFITWAEETSFTDAYWRRKVEEAWVVVWPEHLTHPAFLDGVDLAALAADYTALTGRPFPAVVPPVPAPVPSPPPSPTPAADPRLVEALDLMQAWALDNNVGSPSKGL